MNGEIRAPEAARVSLLDPGFLFGEGVFETIRACSGRAFRLDGHLRRLEESLPMLGMDAPADLERRVREGVAAVLAELTAAWDGVLKVVCWRQVDGGLGVAVMPRELPAGLEAMEREGVRLRLAPFPQGTSPSWRAKTLAYLDRRLARREAEREGAFDALFVTSEGFVAEGAATAIFWVRDGRVFTPSGALGIVASLSRGDLVEMASKLGMVVEAGAFPVEALAAAEEAFVTNRVVGVLAVREVHGAAIAQAPGPLTGKLLAAWKELLERECGDSPPRTARASSSHS